MLMFVLLAPLLMVGEAVVFTIGGGVAFLLIVCLVLSWVCEQLRRGLTRLHAIAARGLRK